MYVSGVSDILMPFDVEFTNKTRKAYNQRRHTTNNVIHRTREQAGHTHIYTFTSCDINKFENSKIYQNVHETDSQLILVSCLF